MAFGGQTVTKSFLERLLWSCSLNPHIFGEAIFVAQRLRIVCALLLAVSLIPPAVSQEPTADAEPVEKKDQLPIVELSKRVTESLVKIRVTNRDSRGQGHGSGFVIGEDGLIATARHVIGDRKLVTIELPDGTEAVATHVYAASDDLDLAILKVDAKGLKALPLGEISEAQSGQSVVTVGHPGSLKNSTFAGILSGFKEIEGIKMLQLSMTIEKGSSGEPVVDRQGNVIGLVVLKSVEVANLGFAVPVNYLKDMLENPTPLPMSHWMKIGALDETRWENVFGANWNQRAGRILVDGNGNAFGGRSLCLQTHDAPEIPYEVQVEVKLNDERGAAGLAFHSDGNEKHYGFYPSNRNIRLTQFNGPDLGSWTILHNKPHSTYRENDWNTFKVRVEAEGFQCFLNGELITKSVEDRIPPGRIGLATFRGTEAEFRRFRVADRLPSPTPNAEDRKAIANILTAVKHNRPAINEVVQQLQPYRQFTTLTLQQQADQLEQKAKHLRDLSREVHAAAMRKQILIALGHNQADSGDSKERTAAATPNLLKAALLIARMDNEEVEPDVYVERVEQLTAEVLQAMPENATEAERLKTLDEVLFTQYGFAGSRYDYETRSNSYLNEVIDDRRGIPITLSVLYMEIARRIKLNVVGLGLPGHFVVRFEPTQEGASAEIIDIFNGGKRLSTDEARQMVRRHGFPEEQMEEFLQAQNADQIVHRMLLNLLGLAEGERDDERVLRYLNTIIAIDETDLNARSKRLQIRAMTGRLEESIKDLDWLLNNRPSVFDADRLYELRASLQRQLDEQNTNP